MRLLHRFLCIILFSVLTFLFLGKQVYGKGETLLAQEKHINPELAIFTNLLVEKP